ncbi:P-loop containing nucleoside triphosphate hydrolase protein [Hygrophoropsis aurantiaca]|uniref:P-loop containing nucleoside triphosphate hydrolase protein n=1 Tax=Hygrophoropsis aurantiaca TaxID=72124 RepID=A0ACB8AEX0_9AGAM|nr:P-loop containing nucleoside triphosphate hydrolase protein [Hygrophoropsis aurantiaca]
MRSFIGLAASLVLLAGQALALTIDVGGSVGNVPANEFLNVTDTYLLNDCQTQCNNATSAINNCGTSDSCLCGPSTVEAITSCEQCMFDVLITNFAVSSDPRAGSQAALTAYGAACLASTNITVPAPYLALAIPSNWDGPYGVSLGLPATALTVAVGTLLGGGAILLLLRYALVTLANRYSKTCWASLTDACNYKRRVVQDHTFKHLPHSLPRHSLKVHNPSNLSATKSTCPRILQGFAISAYYSNCTLYTHDRPANHHRPFSSSHCPRSQQARLLKSAPVPEYPSNWTSSPSTAPSAKDDVQPNASSLSRPIKENATSLGDRKTYIRRIIPPYMQRQSGDRFYDEIQAYNERFLPLLDSEQAEDEAVLRERLSTWTLGRLKEEGYCLTNLSAYWLDTPQFGRPVASFLLGPGIVLPEHRFENGTQVLVSRIDPLKEPPLRGSVLGSSMTQLRIAFEDKFDLDLDDGGAWRLDIGRSNIVFDRMRTAISHFNHDPAAQEADSTPDRQFVLQGTHLRDALLRSFPPTSPSLHAPLQAPDEVAYISHETLDHQSRENSDHGGAFKDDMRIQSWARRHLERNPIRIDGDPLLAGLNSTQVRAIAMMVGEGISLVQGPPGTGKTKTIIEAVKLLKLHFQVPQPLLVCTYTNVAVDNLVEGFASSGIKPLRVGYGGKIKSSLYKHTLDYKLEQHPLKPRVDSLISDQERLEKRRSDLAEKIQNESKAPRLERMRTAFVSVERQAQVIKSKLYALHQEMLREITSEADVICTTCITSANVALHAQDFPVVFLDEASMSTEPASLIPLMRGSRHVALIGDHKQLPPVITSREAQLKGLGISLFERLTEEGAVPSIMLDIQYRMHPSISHFPSSEFYNFSLQDGTIDSAGNVSPNLIPPLSTHLAIDTATGNRPSIVFLDHAGSESAKDRSRVNWNEASIVCSVVEDLLLQNEHLRGKDIGIIAPYAAQISLLTRLLNTDAKYKTRFLATLGDHRAMQLADIEVKTVDGFEGREKEIIIFSTVRNNSSGYIGFLADRRRLNVGLTRAKRGLFVVGSISTLKAGKMAKGRASESGQGAARVGKGAEAWRRYAEYLCEQRMVLTLSGEKLRKVLYGTVPRTLKS